MLGTVKNFDEKRGFGFISSLGHKKDIFVHYSQIKRRGMKILKAGDEVSFRLVQGDTGPVAESVRLLDSDD
jgi:cold shock protein